MGSALTSPQRLVGGGDDDLPDQRAVAAGLERVHVPPTLESVETGLRLATGTVVAARWRRSPPRSRRASFEQGLVADVADRLGAFETGSHGSD
jgi:hypothetical protein